MVRSVLLWFYHSGTRFHSYSRALAFPAVIVFFSINAAAHHSAPPHFDLEKTVQLQGTVTKFEFANPPGYVFFAVTGADGVNGHQKA